MSLVVFNFLCFYILCTYPVQKLPAMFVLFLCWISAIRTPYWNQCQENNGMVTQVVFSILFSEDMEPWVTSRMVTLLWKIQKTSIDAVHLPCLPMFSEWQDVYIALVLSHSKRTNNYTVCSIQNLCMNKYDKIKVVTIFFEL